MEAATLIDPFTESPPADPATIGHPAPLAWALAAAVQEFGGPIRTEAWLKDRTERAAKACAEIGREVGLRRAVYPRFVKTGKMTQEDADRLIATLEDAARLIRELMGVPR